MKQTALVCTTMFLAIFGAAEVLAACGIEGSVTRTDGSKVDGTAKISTSRNSEVAYPKNGHYTLDVGSAACGEKAEVYANGYSIGKYKIPKSGFVTVDVVLKGQTDFPVR